jgi:hypothetical protein
MWQAAEHAGLHLLPRQARVFDEVNDIVNYDLVLVMDSFDAVEVPHPSIHSVWVLDIICSRGLVTRQWQSLQDELRIMHRTTSHSLDASTGNSLTEPFV